MTDDWDVRPSFVDRLPVGEERDKLLNADLDQLMPMVRERAIVDSGFDLVPQPDADADQVKKHLAEAQAAARLVAEEGDDAPLTEQQQLALELFILLTSRPALFVVGGSVRDRPQNWPVLEENRALVDRRIKGVGRIELAPGGRANTRGTGFLVGERRVLTNNHVLASLFGASDLSRWERDPGWFEDRVSEANQNWLTGGGPTFELIGELASTASSASTVTRILGHHVTVDVALVEIAQEPTGARYLRLAAEAPDGFADRKMYALGYPVRDLSTPPAVLQRIFGAGDARGTKRCSPGLVMRWDGGQVFEHDASTLPGSSGSAVVDLGSDEVVGIHFAGQFERRNLAVAVWTLKDHPLFADHGVIFGG
jgi:Trypsin-like peptidase domain